MLRIWKFCLPLLIFFTLLGFLFKGLSLDPHEIPSPLINRPAPEFSLPQLHAPAKMLSKADMRGKVWLLNVWASWCASCRVEHPLWIDAAKQNGLTIIGLNWKDEHSDALAWLNQFGNPYQASIADIDGKVAIDFGVYGAPETFIIDKTGMIRHKQIGPVNAEIMRDVILPLIRDLEKS